MATKKKIIEIKEDDKPDYIGHRQRLRLKFTSDIGRTMLDYELLELLLTYALPRQDVKPLAKTLIRHYKSYANVIAAPIEELMAIPGVGNYTAVLIKVVHATVNKVCWENLDNHDSPILNNKKALVEYCRSRIGYAGEERILVIYQDIHGNYIRDEIEQVGTIDAVFLSPREIIGKAILLKASEIVVVHNHPSGEFTPSKMDIEMTKTLKEALKQVRIKLQDHIVISKRGYYSMREHFPFMNS
jgi:DNA repair protein RadC